MGLSPMNGEVSNAHDDPKGAKDQTHLPKKLEGRRYYRPTASPSIGDEEDLNAPW